MGFLALGALVLVVGGCVCVVWADRGGPRWVRLVARATVGAGELVRRAGRSRRRGVSQGDSSGD
ncbi:hypothetical protein ACIRPK_00480 [Kitasatospora sp. NPDC101801]|uniref:hypothetical protein n=1 Tax=Kitasatospora sp. NPDC101801 TaxID=3364103 RepID=UPI0037F3D371